MIDGSTTTVAPLSYESVGPDQADRVHALYLSTPGYFDTLSIPLPSVEEVRTDLSTAANDARRITELVSTPHPQAEDVAYLDMTLDYLRPGDATVNLLLVRGDLQRRGIGRTVVGDVVRRLEGRYRRVLASVYRRNPDGRRFWTSLGFHFAIDAAPVLEWYAKRLGDTSRTQAEDSSSGGETEPTA